jgi:hypothetical protein
MLVVDSEVHMRSPLYKIDLRTNQSWLPNSFAIVCVIVVATYPVVIDGYLSAATGVVNFQPSFLFMPTNKVMIISWGPFIHCYRL